MATAPTMATQSVPELLRRLSDVDSDIRFMSLSDLIAIFSSSSGTYLASDFGACCNIVDGLMHTLNDNNAEVQNLTIKCLGYFAGKSHSDVLPGLINRVGDLEKQEDFDQSIAALALRQIVTSMPRPIPTVPRLKAVQDAYKAVSLSIIPRLLGRIVVPATGRTAKADKTLRSALLTEVERGSDGTNLDLLTEVARCFGPMLQMPEIDALQDSTLRVLGDRRTSSVMKKKAVVALCALAPYFNDGLLSVVSSHLIEKLRDVHLTPSNHRSYLTILGALARAIPKNFGPHLTTLVPFTLNPLSPDELDVQTPASDDEGQGAQADEVKEAALIALEAFLVNCPDDMNRYSADSIDAALRCVRYDPNLAASDDEDGEEDELADDEDDFELDEDFEQEAVGGDEDDLSWKVRRCATKLLHTVISIRSREVLEDEQLYDRILRALTDRFKEREDGVRVEDLATLAALIRKTAEADGLVEVPVAGPLASSTVPASLPTRKRRRRDSDISMYDAQSFKRPTGSKSPEHPSSPQASASAILLRSGASITTGLLKLGKTASVPTKQASVMTLRAMTAAQQGGLDEVLSSLVEQLVENIVHFGNDSRAFALSNPSSATQSSLAIESMQLIGEICKTHSSKVVQPYFAKLVPAATAVCKIKAPRIACQGLQTIEQMLKVLTPPRDAAGAKNASAQLEQLLNAVMDPLSSKNVDTVVRQEAIGVLAILLARTKGSALISNHRRAEALSVVLETLRSETTRQASILAIERMLCMVEDMNGFDSAWIGDVSLELVSQLRKSDRALRGSSLQALRVLLDDRHGFQSIPAHVVPQLAGSLTPLLKSDDLHMIGSTLTILSALIDSGNSGLLDATFTQFVVALLRSPSSSSVMDPLCALMHSVGRDGTGQAMMQALLREVGIDGKAVNVGKILGNLLVAGGDSVGITVDDFLKELQFQEQAERKCLALSILGEVGFLSGEAASLKPGLFTQYFGSASDAISLNAAIALGRTAAGSGNAELYLPEILKRASGGKNDRHLALHALRETLQYNANPRELQPFAGQLWEAAVGASQGGSSRELGSECIASLAMLEPKMFLPKVQALAQDTTPSARAIAILALRDIYTNGDATLDRSLRSVTTDTVTAIMRDADLENRRAALNTFNAASRNKPALILPYMEQLLPLVLDQTYEDPSLIREVTMGPFKHRVDDGLECRKGAYETMYSLVEVAPARIDLSKVYDRVIAGVGDEHNIRSLCNLLVAKFLALAPDEVERRLDELADKFKGVMSQKTKENAVRHEVEKAEDTKKGVVKISLELSQKFPGATNPVWTGYVESLKTEHKKLLDDAAREGKERAA